MGEVFAWLGRGGGVRMFYGDVFGLMLWVWEMGWGRREVRAAVSGLAADRLWRCGLRG